MAGAEFAMAMDSLWADHEARNIPMACTFGRFHTDPAAHGLTIVPGVFHFSLDVRAYDDAVLAALGDEIGRIIDAIEQRRSVRFHLGAQSSAAPGRVDAAVAAGLLASAQRQGISVLQFGSPASHDAAAFAACGVPIGMLFVRNQNGSHNPYEAMEIDDFLDGVEIALQWVASASV